MTTDHPITPPPELVKQWLQERYGALAEFAVTPSESALYLTTAAARWGADQELEACIDFVRRGPWCSEKLRAARRPKPPSLKEQALEALDSAAYQPGSDFKQIDPTRSAILRRALEQLDD